MLSDHERATLREIQRHLIVEDPDLDQSLRAFTAPASPTRYRWIYTTLVILTAALVPVMLLIGSIGGTVAFAVIAGTLWWTRYLQYGTKEPEREG